MTTYVRYPGMASETTTYWMRARGPTAANPNRARASRAAAGRPGAMLRRAVLLIALLICLPADGKRQPGKRYWRAASRFLAVRC